MATQASVHVRKDTRPAGPGHMIQVFVKENNAWRRRRSRGFQIPSPKQSRPVVAQESGSAGASAAQPQATSHGNQVQLGTVTEKAGFSDKKAASAQRIELTTLIFERTYVIIRS